MENVTPKDRLGIEIIALFVMVFFVSFLGFQAVRSIQSSGQTPSLATTSNASAAASGQATVGLQTEDDDQPVTLTLLHNNDGESKLLPNADGGFPGIARFTQLLQDLGSESEADILLRVTSGDNFLASKEFTAGLERTNLPLYDAIALSGLYEAMAFGNHDFDFGPEVTARFVEEFSPAIPFVAANIDVADEPELQALFEQGRIAPFAVITDPSTGLEVGVIGAITPRLPNISSPRNVRVDADVATSINTAAEALLNEGINRIVLVSHLQNIDEERELIPQLSNVDIVVAGGGDELLRNDGDSCLEDEEAAAPYPLLVNDNDGVEIPLVTGPGGYRCIGKLDVTFDAEGLITEFTGSAIGVPLDGPTEQYAIDAVEAPLTRAIAELEATVLAESDVVLDGRRSSIRTGPTNAGELLADAMLAAPRTTEGYSGDPAQVAVVNAGGIRNDAEIPAGQITAADTFDIAPFANFAVVVEIPREQFKEMLEVGVAGLPEAEGTYPQVAGFSMEIDTEQPARGIDPDANCAVSGEAGSRIRNVVLDDGTEIVTDGQVVAGEPIRMATIDFLAAGGDCYPLTDLDTETIGVSYQQALASFITDELDGTISADDYPVESERVTVAGAEAVPEDDEPDEPDEADPEPEPTPVPEATDDPADDNPSSELANTGSSTALALIVAATIACAGYLVIREARLAGRISFVGRLWSTSSWGTPDHDSHDDPESYPGG